MTLLDAHDSKPLQGGPSFSFRNRLFRLTWTIAWTLLAAWTPPPLHRWRVWLLNSFGAEIHKTAHVYSSVKVWYPPNLVMEEYSCLGPRVICYCMARIHLMKGAIVSQGSHLCAGMHDIQDPEFQLLVKPITIGINAWIATECFVGPAVNICNGAVLGARGVLLKNTEPYGVYVGNPAILIKHRKVY